jgi:hypothetical protein
MMVWPAVTQEYISTPDIQARVPAPFEGSGTGWGSVSKFFTNGYKVNDVSLLCTPLVNIRGLPPDQTDNPCKPCGAVAPSGCCPGNILRRSM